MAHPLGERRCSDRDFRQSQLDDDSGQNSSRLTFFTAAEQKAFDTAPTCDVPVKCWPTGQTHRHRRAENLRHLLKGSAAQLQLADELTQTGSFPGSLAPAALAS